MPLDIPSDEIFYFQRESPVEGYPIFLKFGERGDYDRYVEIDGEFLRLDEPVSQEMMFIIIDSELAVYLNELEIMRIELPYSERARSFDRIPR